MIVADRHVSDSYREPFPTTNDLFQVTVTLWNFSSSFAVLYVTVT